MTSAIELATAYVPILPSMRDFSRVLTPELEQAGRRGGQAGGEAASRAFEQAFDVRRLGNSLGQELERAGRLGGQQGGEAASRGFEQAFDPRRFGDGLGRELERSGRQGGQAAGEAASRGFEQAFDPRRFGNGLGREMERSGRQGGQQGGEAAGESMGSSLTDRIKGMGGKAGPIAAVLATVVGAAGLAAGAALAKALGAGFEQERVADLTQARLGVDDATMHKIGTAAGAAYANVFGESIADNMDTARRAIQSGLLDPNATAQETQEVIQQLSGVADIMGEEIPAVSRAAGQAIKTGMAANAEEAFDLFVKAEQAGLNVSEDFLDTITEYGTQFRKLGLEGPDALGLINQAVKAGARDVDTAADAIKEFSIRAVDGSESSAAAFEELNLNAEEIGQQFAAGGDSARRATQQILTGLRGIEDPLLRGQVSVGLFGTKWEDLGAAFDAFDLDTAASSLGNVAGAADAALSTIGDNAATSIEGAKRSIEVSATGIQKALAQAFGPSLERVATWVSTHQPEITGFFITVGDAAFTLLDAILALSARGLRNFAIFIEGMGGMLKGVLEPIGLVAEGIGALTGDDDLKRIGDSLQTFDDRTRGAAETARSLADAIDNDVRPGLNELRGTFLKNAEAARNTQEVMRALGDQVTAIPTAHGITLSDNVPEVNARLEALGIAVTELPDGTVSVSATTAAAQQTLNDFITANTGRPVELTGVVTRLDISGNITDNPAQQTVRVPGGRYAHGGIVEPGNASISNRTVNQWAEAGPEAFIPLSPGKRDRSIPIWMEVGRRLGMFASFANGGIVEAQRFATGEAGKPYQYGGVGNPSWDCSGFLSGIYATLTGKNPRTRWFTTESDFTSLGFIPGLGGPNDFSVGIRRGGGGPLSHMAGTLGTVDVESSGTDGVEVGAGAQGAADFPLKFHLPLGGDDPNAPTGSTGSGFGIGGGGGGTSGGGGGGLSGGGGGTALDPGGDTQRVFVTNMPTGGFGGGLSTDSGTATTTSASTTSDAEQGTTGTAQGQPQNVDLLDSALKLLGGDYDGGLARIGIEEDNPLVTATLGIRNLLAKGDYDGNLADSGIEEDHPLVTATLGVRNLLAKGDFDGNLSDFGIEEDHPLVAATLGVRNLLAEGDYDGNLATVGIEEDNPLVDATLSVRDLLAEGNYDGRLTNFGIEEDHPLVAAVLGIRNLLEEGDYDGNLSAVGIEEDNPLVDAALRAREKAATAQPDVQSSTQSSVATPSTLSRAATPQITDTPSASPSTVEPSQEQHPLSGIEVPGFLNDIFPVNELFDGPAPWYMAASPEQALANLGSQASTLWQRTTSDVTGLFSDFLPEMLGTGAALLGMGAVGGGGMTVNNYGMDPKKAGEAVARQQRRRSIANQRRGGLGR